jgi:hypothetical protein
MRTAEVSRVRPTWLERLVREAKSPPLSLRGHPTEAQLNGFAEGNVGRAVAGAVGVHLYDCGRCQRLVIVMEGALHEID